jgi:UDP-2,4-diacetamido-2,4,6-trideoxy-beta-L-altropyranose hydrolase
LIKKVYIRADGNAATGLGHLYRSFALMEILQDSFDCTFVTRENSITTVIPPVYNRVLIPAEISLVQEPKWLQTTLDPKTVLIADGYHFTTSYQKQIKEAGFNLIYIDDLATEHFYADAVINHAPYVAIEGIKKEVYTSCYFGTKYALLRPLFLAQAAIQKTHIDPMHSVFVCFGGADALDLTLKATQSLLTFRHIKLIHIVLGAAYKKTEIDAVSASNNRVVIHRNIGEAAMIEVMQSCQFAIAPASTIVYELCCVKMAILGGYYVPNQIHIYQGLLAHQVIFEGGNFKHYTIADFTHKLETCFIQESSTLIKNQGTLFDASIQHRLKNIVHSLSEHFEIRRATQDDMLLFFNWANEPYTRTMSFHSEPIPLENHTQWFAKQLRAIDSHILILEVLQNDKKIPVGNVKCNAEGVIGISLDIHFRGKGLGAFLINQGLQFIAQNSSYPCIFAYIKEENTKSLSVFEQAGFLFSKNTQISNTPCLEYTFTPSA